MLCGCSTSRGCCCESWLAGFQFCRSDQFLGIACNIPSSFYTFPWYSIFLRNCLCLTSVFFFGNHLWFEQIQEIHCSYESINQEESAFGFLLMLLLYRLSLCWPIKSISPWNCDGMQMGEFSVNFFFFVDHYFVHHDATYLELMVWFFCDYTCVCGMLNCTRNLILEIPPAHWYFAIIFVEYQNLGVFYIRSLILEISLAHDPICEGYALLESD